MFGSLSLHRILNTLFFERDILLGERRIDNLRRWNVSALNRYFSALPDGGIKTVPVIEDFNPDVIYNNYISKKQPVVLKGAAAGWDATKNWSFDYFKHHYGNDDVYIADETFNRSRDGTYYDIKLLPYKMTDFVDAVNNGKDLYLKFLPTFRKHPELLTHLDLSSMSAWCKNRADKYETTNEFYMGGTGSVTHLHTERSHIFHACIVGKKRWRLYGPENSVYLYPVPARTLFIASEVDFMNPDYDLHPWFRYANGYETVLEEGDILYFPSYYWHAVENLSPTISANYLWHVVMDAFMALPLMWCNGEILRSRGSGTIEQFIKFFSGRFLPNLHS